MSTRCRRDAPWRAHEQRIIECGTKLAQRHAHCGLAHAELLRGAADAGLVVEREHDEQEIEIEFHCRRHSARRAHYSKTNGLYSPSLFESQISIIREGVLYSNTESR